MSAARDVAKALGGIATADGGWLVRCPLPTHGKGKGDRRPSLSVRDGNQGGVVLFCFASCHPLEVKDELRRRGIIEPFAGDRKSERQNVVLKPRLAKPVGPHEPDPEAVARWQDGRVGAGLVRTYLEGRGISLPVPPTLREGRRTYRDRNLLPSMLAAVQGPDRRVIAVQDTLLTWAGRKSPVTVPKITTGRLGAGAVRLGPAAEAMGLAEGVETGLSAMQLFDVPVWVSLGGQRLAKLYLPPIVKELHVFADNDEAGRLAAGIAASHFTAQGLRVVLRWPPEGFKDWNDVVQAQAREAAA